MSEDAHCSHSEATHGNHACGCPSCNATEHSSTMISSEENLPTFSQRTEAATLTIEIGFLCFAIVLFLLGRTQGFRELVGDLSISFVAIMLEAMPFMLLGSVVGGLIETFVPQEWVSRSLAGRKHATVFVAAGLGLVFPVCECAIVPVVRRLLHKGVPLSGAIAFLLGGPIVNPIVAGSTWLAYRSDWSFLGTRMICGYSIAVAVALIMNFLLRDKNVLLDEATLEHGSSCGCGVHNHEVAAEPAVARFFAAFQHACDDFFDVGRFLVIGAFVAALARTLIGVDALGDLFGSPGIAILMMMGLAVALNLCSETDAFIAAGFRGVLPDTAQMAFMVLGPMLDMKLLLMYLTMFRKRAIVTLSLLVFMTVLAAMLLLQYGLGGLPGGQ
ncbi:MAG: permease [Desulfomonile tiedjei]|uniref:Permease n=1 Tax=Desulfomonile tiedjei TaxID=2358 RepID=A0A9D6V5W9_9BACT|nr:permease [Desulfomonile tiedjei]